MLRDAGARLKVRRWLPPLLMAGVILFVTSVPVRVVPRQLSPYDKVVHFAMYGLLAVLLTRDISQTTGRWRAMIVSIAAVVAFGAADEWHQRFVAGRDSDLADLRADSVGAAGGALIFALYSRIRRSRTSITK